MLFSNSRTPVSWSWNLIDSIDSLRDDIDFLDQVPYDTGVPVDRQRMASIGWVFQDMKIVPLLVFCSLSLVHSDGLVRSTGPFGRDISHAAPHVTSVVIQRARDVFFPDDLGVGSSLWDENEEDSVEDMFLDSGPCLFRSSRNPGLVGLSSLIRAHRDLFRKPSRPHPLRC